MVAPRGEGGGGDGGWRRRGSSPGGGADRDLFDGSTERRTLLRIFRRPVADCGYHPRVVPLVPGTRRRSSRRADRAVILRRKVRPAVLRDAAHARQRLC